MIIERKVLDALGIKQYHAVKKYFSRRNKVYLVRGERQDGAGVEFVYKEYVAGDIEREYEYLQKLKGLPVPAVMARGERSLALSCIAGKTMLERLEEAESSGAELESCIDGLLDFLHRFYSALPGRIYGDVNLRNFIVTHEGVYGVDVEEAGPGDICSDIGRAAAFLLTYRPSFTDYKNKAAEYLIDKACGRFGLNKGLIENAMRSELCGIQNRRVGKKPIQI